MSSLSKIHVVGEKFINVANNHEIATFSEIIQRVDMGKLPQITLCLEQGVSEVQQQELQAKLYNNKQSNDVKVESYFSETRRCSDHYTHKKQSFNTLISEPICVSQDNYVALLMINETCAELSDHVTGKHVQFMVLVEAARQMVNAVTEKFYSDSSKIYLASDLQINFTNFVYPFRTEIHYSVMETKMKEGGNGKMKAKIDFIQHGELKSTIFFCFTILDKNFVTEIENKAINAFVAA